MSEPQRTALYVLLPVLRAAFFDFIWPAFRWIQSIWIKESNRQFQLFVEAAAPPNEKEQDDFDYLVKRMLAQLQKSNADVMPELATYKIEFTVQYGASVPRDGGYQELMSDAWFKKMAAKFAPGRLENGR
jgi:hypothetical protein